MGRLAGIAALGLVGVDRHDGAAAAALEGVLPVAAVGEEVGADGSQEGPEAAAGGVGRGQDVLLQQADEEILGQVQGTVGVVAPAADVGVEGEPVGPTELGQRLAGEGRTGIAGRDDAAPVGRREAAAEGSVMCSSPFRQTGRHRVPSPDQGSPYFTAWRCDLQRLRSRDGRRPSPGSASGSRDARSATARWIAVGNHEGRRPAPRRSRRSVPGAGSPAGAV